jgi:RNA polymerase sigma-70 factor, ECF subfamily
VAIGDWVPAVEQSRFDATGYWAAPPQHCVEETENRIDAAKLADRRRSAVGELPVRQREVVLLRDVEGLSSEEVRGVREISEGKDEFVTLYRQWRGAGEDGT